MNQSSDQSSQGLATGESLSQSDVTASFNGKISGFFYYLRRNLMLASGIVMLLILFFFWLIGSIFVDPRGADPISAPQARPPLQEYTWPLGSDETQRSLLGTDFNGRKILPLMVHGAPLTLRIGLLAGVIGLGIGIILGFIAGYMRGAIDTVIRIISDVGITIPSLAVLVVVASTVAKSDLSVNILGWEWHISEGAGLSVNMMGLIVASLSWMWPTRVIRSQVLSMRESNYVEVARLNGMGDLEIIFRELMPNLLPFLAASFVGAIGSGILAAVGLEALGLGPQSEPTLGMTVYWSIYYGALLSNWWWWYVPPIVLLAWIFVTLFLLAGGLDEWANPRLRQSL